MSDDQPNSMKEERIQSFSPVHVNVKESVGAAFLGLLSLILLVALLRAEARFRAFVAESERL